MSTVGVIDYGMGNLHSIAKALEYVSAGERIVVSYDPDVLNKADRLVLPGVGAIGHCMDELRRLELTSMVAEVIGDKPILGVCLGMQVLMSVSQENEGIRGLGVFPGEVVRFPEPIRGADDRRKVPHMGWNQVRQERSHKLWDGIDQEAWFYFVHSYYAVVADSAHCMATAEYGERFCCSLLRDNVFAVQFHPEKSQSAGLALLANFLSWDGQA